jgi:hypothetical protein
MGSIRPRIYTGKDVLAAQRRFGRAVRAVGRAGFLEASACPLERMALRPVCPPTLLRARPNFARDGGVRLFRCDGLAGRRVGRSLSVGRLKSRPLRWDRWFESGSLQQTVRLSPASAIKRREPGFPRGCARLAWRPGRQRRAGCFDIAPIGRNISVGPYSSTAVPLMGSARMPRCTQRSWAFTGLILVVR